ELPPLRERKEDLPLLAQAFILEFNRKHGTKVIAMREETISRIKEYGWPGNVRELRNTMERAVIMCKGEWIELPHLPPYIQNPSIEPPEKLVLPEGITAAEAERELIMKTLSRVGYNKAEAARQLGLDVKTIRNKLRTYGMEGPLG
ncbi:MAG: sigma-54-dependent Fis family transcriptional regulator, partial [Acidobacteria bacterium]|nr:sigma-54-dependent Fis family transcriptional regulator [Acidobacteriota bacterium]